VIAETSGTWTVYYNFDQYVYEPVKGSGKGFGVFGRLGATDGNPNFLKYFYSLGVGGKGVIPSRPDDSFGLGWYYIDIKNLSLETPIGTAELLRDEQGVEAYYNLALTPWAHLSPDVQVVRGGRTPVPPAQMPIDTAVVLGLRLRLDI
jgi:porin